MAVTDSDLVDWRERQYVSQYSQTPLSFSIFIGGVLADPDSSTVMGELLIQNADGSVSPVNSYTATREATGVYTITPPSADVSIPAQVELVWTYTISSQPQNYVSYLLVGPSNPHYDGLPLLMRDFLEEQVWVRFADLFDSPDGGPNLQTYFQAHWSRGRMAQLMNIALSKINAVAQPWSNYTLDGMGGAQFPVQLWGGLLASYTYVEAVKQLIRSYTEQPNFQGAGVARLDRRDYSQRWRGALADEQAELKSLLDVFKIRHLGLGNPRVLVAGGVYGRYAPTRIAGSVAARPRMWARLRWY
jgi:hypothetical protein